MKRATLILFCLLLAHSAWAIDPPPLAKADAKRIMEVMQWTDVTIVVIRQGVDGNGVVAPIYATVIGFGNFNGVHRSLSQTLCYDLDLDWHYLQMGAKTAQIWNKNGFQEIKPWPAW